jgi:hypothetical protein
MHLPPGDGFIKISAQDRHAPVKRVVGSSKLKRELGKRIVYCSLTSTGMLQNFVARSRARFYPLFVLSVLYYSAIVQGAENRAVVGSGGRGVCRVAHHSRAEGEGTACSAAGS